MSSEERLRAAASACSPSHAVMAYLVRVAEGDETGAAAAAVRASLRALSWLYLGALNASALAHRIGIRRRERVSCPVIAIGNLTVGGTGKSTVTATVAGWARDADLRPVILSRGYGARGRPTVRVVSDGESLLLGPEDGGDEPVMLAGRLTGVPVLVGRRRPVTARAAIQQFGAGLCILDDGFQVWNLVKDLEIVLLDSRRAFHNGFVLPRGMLREPPGHLDRADVVVLMEPDRVGGDRLAELRARVQVLAPGAAIAEACRAPESLWRLAGEDQVSLARLAGLRALALSAIGNPEVFEDLLRGTGAVVHPLRFPNHHHYTLDDLERIQAFARECGAEAIVTTDKDAVKLRPLAQPCAGVGVWECGDVGVPERPSRDQHSHSPTPPHPHTPVWVLSIGLRFLSGEDALRKRVLAVANGARVA